VLYIFFLFFPVFAFSHRGFIELFFIQLALCYFYVYVWLIPVN
jgi:hypothetical protein